MRNLSILLQRPPARLLVVSACSSKKASGNLNKKQQLTADDLDNPSLREAGEARLAQYRRPATEMYKGNGHSFVRSAVQALRDHGYPVSHYILSAGYGLLRDTDEIVPYDVTFNGMPSSWIRNRGQCLRLRTQLVELAKGHNALILVLGREYLDAIGLPLPTDRLPYTIAYVAPSLAGIIGNNVETIPIGPEERRRIQAYSASAKERLFQLNVAAVLQGG